MRRYRLFRLLLPALGRCHRVAGPLAGLAGRVVMLHGPTRRRLERTFAPLCAMHPGQTRRTALAVAAQVARYYVDLGSLRYRDAEALAGRELHLADPDRLEHLSTPGPRIIVGGHTAGAELALRALPVWGYAFTALVEDVGPPPLSAFLARWRSAPGARYLVMDARALRECLATLSGGGLVALMADRDIRGNGVCVEFFGRRVRFPRGPWELAARTEALVIPVLSSRGRHGRIEVSIEDPLRLAPDAPREREVAAAAQCWAGILERHLLRDPGQWLIMEDFWRVHRCGQG